MRHVATRSFWFYYRQLPEDVQRLADKCYALLRQNPQHPSLHLKKVRRFWSVRVGLHYSALGVEDNNDLVWFWVGTHAEYDKHIGRQ